MKKLVSLFVLCMVLTVTVGCSGSSTTSKPAAKPTEGDKK